MPEEEQKGREKEKRVGGGGRQHGGWDGERVREQEGWGSAWGALTRQKRCYLKLRGCVAEREAERS